MVVFYDTRRGNGAGLFSKEKVSKGDQQGKSEEKRISREAYDKKQQNNMYSAEIKKQIKGALRPPLGRTGLETGFEVHV